jgi:hypothetical protein
MGESVTPRPGVWHHDQSGRHEFRYGDGAVRTSVVSDAGVHADGDGGRRHSETGLRAATPARRVRTMNKLGFEGKVPANWNKLWLIMWAVTAPAVIASAFHMSFWQWLPIALVGFLLPEMVSIFRKNDSLPPLTHAFRHFVPNWVAFPVIYFSLGSIGANWLGFERPLRIGVLLGLLGWLTDHFTVTYAKPDPFPYSKSERPVEQTARIPA